MGSVVPRSAGPERIFEDFGEALDNGQRRTGAVKETVETRLGPLAVGVDMAEDEWTADKAALDEADKVLMVIDIGSDLEVGAVIDEVWNGLGRPASSVEYTLIAGRGKAQWTDGNPREQAILMAILAANLRRTTAPTLQAGKEGWAQRIDARTALQAPAADLVRKAEAKLAVSAGIARGVADLAQVALARLKRDLQNIGQTEAQIHEIIPSYQPTPRAPAKGGKPDGKTPAEPKAGEAKAGEAKPAPEPKPDTPT